MCVIRLIFRFLETHKDWFTEEQYKDAIKQEKHESDDIDVDMRETATTAEDSS